MQRKINICLAAILLAFVAGCAALPGSGSHQRDLECPADLDSYCGGWTVYAANMPDEPIHIAKNDRFVIGRGRTGEDSLAFYPRATMLGRWYEPDPESESREPQKRGIPNPIALTEVTSRNQHRCLVGLVQLKAEHKVSKEFAYENPPHRWHRITVRRTAIFSRGIGEEESLDICLEPLEDDDRRLIQCAPIKCIDYDYLGNQDPRSHGGRAHAHD